MTKMLYIVSLSHSGSTLLDMILGSHRCCVGLGEIEKVLVSIEHDSLKYTNNLCSCGMRMTDCAFWGKMFEKLVNYKGSLIDKYRFVIEQFQNDFGQDTILIDSSKKIESVIELNKHFHFSIKTIFVIKDVRNYVNSAIRNYKRDNRKLNFLESLVYYHYLNWHKQNKKIFYYLTKNSINYMCIGYEDLCFNKNIVVNNICKFIGIDYEKDMLNLSNSKSHILVGNRMRNQKEKQEILYDYSWFKNKKLLLSSFLFPHIMKFNNKFVYNPSYTERWNR
jgi:hypothetical protein